LSAQRAVVDLGRERPPFPRFSASDVNQAHDEWGVNCGPAALAAIMGMTLADVRPHMGDFEAKGYTNPTLMFAALESIGRPWRRIGSEWPKYGLVRVQWEGPWTKHGVPIRARYGHTHWVGYCTGSRYGDCGVFDVNALRNRSGWVCYADWRNIVVPWILAECEPGADGRFHITHGIEVEP
jgi:hypothetical protein